MILVACCRWEFGLTCVHSWKTTCTLCPGLLRFLYFISFILFLPLFSFFLYFLSSSFFSSILWLRVAYFLYFMGLKYTLKRGFFFWEMNKMKGSFYFFVSCNFLAEKLKFSTTLADCFICIYFTSQMCIFGFLLKVSSFFLNFGKNSILLFFSKHRTTPVCLNTVSYETGSMFRCRYGKKVLVLFRHRITI